MNPSSSVTRRDWALTLALIFAYLAVVILSAIFLPEFAYLLAAVGGLFLLVRWHNRRFAYHCRNCDSYFEISALRNFISPHGVDKEGGWKYLKCPACGQRTRARLVKKTPTA